MLKEKNYKLKNKKTNLKQSNLDLKSTNEELNYKVTKLKNEININADDLELMKKKYEEKSKDQKDNFNRKMTD